MQQLEAMNKMYKKTTWNALKTILSKNVKIEIYLILCL